MIPCDSCVFYGLCLTLHMTSRGNVNMRPASWGQNLQSAPSNLSWIASKRVKPAVKFTILYCTYTNLTYSRKIWAKSVRTFFWHHFTPFRFKTVQSSNAFNIFIFKESRRLKMVMRNLTFSLKLLSRFLKSLWFLSKKNTKKLFLERLIKSNIVCLSEQPENIFLEVGTYF